MIPATRSTKIAILDFDHTLFKTEEFWAATRQALRDLYGLNPNQLERERLDRRPDGPGRVAGGEGYDLFVHLHDVYKLDIPVTRAQLVQQLRGNQWLYDGTTALITGLRRDGYEVAILTVGVPAFQEFKRNCCANLPADLPFKTVARNKGEHLAASWHGATFHYGGRTYNSVLIVDDATTTFEALGNRPGLAAIQIVDRPKYPEAARLPWVQRVEQLEEVLAVLN